MRRGTGLLAAVMVLGTAAAARAEGPLAVPAIEETAGPTTQGGVSFIGGSLLLGPLAYGTAGGELELGRRAGPVWLIGRGSWSRLSRPEVDGSGGDCWRYGGGARLPIGGIPLDHRGGGLQFWAGAGVDRRAIRWDAGGRLDRTEWSIDLGFDAAGPMGGGHYVRFGMAMRALFAATAGGYSHDPGVLMVIRMGWLR